MSQEELDGEIQQRESFLLQDKAFLMLFRRFIVLPDTRILATWDDLVV